MERFEINARELRNMVSGDDALVEMVDEYVEENKNEVDYDVRNAMEFDEMVVDILKYAVYREILTK